MAINLRDFDKPLGTVLLPSTGREVAVLPANAIVADLKLEYEQTEQHTLLWDIARELIPDATPEEIKGLRPAHIVVLIKLASGSAEQLLAEIEAEEKKKLEGNSTAPAKSKPRAARKGTGSAS